MFKFLWCKAEFSASLRQSSAIILIKHLNVRCLPLCQTFTLATNNAISKATEDFWTDTFMVLFSYFLQLENPQSPATFILCNIAPSEILQNTFVNHKHLSKWWQNFHCWLNYCLRVYRFYDNAAATWVKESCCTAPWLCTHMNRQRQHHTDSQCYHPLTNSCVSLLCLSPTH